MPRGRLGENNDWPRWVDPRRVDTLCDVLADRKRRAVLRWFRDHPHETTSLQTLSRHLASTDRVTRDGDRIALALHHWVLPKLAEAGVVEYDPRSDSVRYHPEPDVEALLDRIDRWARIR